MQQTEINKYLKERIQDYLNLNIYGVTLPALYHINYVENQIKSFLSEIGVEKSKIEEFHKRFKNKETEYGWGLGKSSPEELEQNTTELLDLYELNQEELSEEGVENIMRLHGIGIDCSGFVYQVLKYTFEELGQMEEFKQSLAWEDRDESATNADVELLSRSSFEINLYELQPADLVIIQTEENNHCGIIFRQEEQLKLAQVSLFIDNAQVSISSLNIEDGRPLFNFKKNVGTDWISMFESGDLKFKRLEL